MVPAPTSTLEDFPFQAEVENGRWHAAAMQKLIASAGIKTVPDAWSSDGYSTARDFSDLERVRVGISVLGFKEGRILVSFAAFDEQSRLLGWSAKPVQYALYPPGQRTDMGFRNQYVKLNTPMKALLAPFVKKAETAPTPALSHEKGATICTAAASPDGRFLFSTGHDGALCIWDSLTGTRLHRITTVGGRGLEFLNSIAVSPDSKSVVTGARNFQRFDPVSGKLLTVFTGHPKGEVKDLAHSSSGKTIASLSASVVRGGDNSVALWNPNTGKRLASFAIKKLQGSSIAFSLDEKSLFVFLQSQAGDQVTELRLPSLEPVINGVRNFPPYRWGEFPDGGQKELGAALSALREVPLKGSFAKARVLLKKFGATKRLGELEAFENEYRAATLLAQTVEARIRQPEEPKLPKLEGPYAPVQALLPNPPRVLGLFDRKQLVVWDAKTGKRLLPNP